MSGDRDEGAFERTAMVDKPSIVGAAWWQESVQASDPIARRRALTALVGVGASVAVASLVAVVASSPIDVATMDRPSLDMQRELGWSFGADSDELTFDGESRRPFDRADLDRMVADLAPAEAAHRPFAVSTLFEAPPAVPRHPIQGDAPIRPLRDVLVPISTPAMDVAYRAGRGLAALLDGVQSPALAVVVDLPGPLAVAFAAGLAGRFDPAFGFDNWPHPWGVVPAHLTLAAAAYYQPLFRRRTAERAAGAPIAFVLDRSRLAPYDGDAAEFDNRHVAKLPAAGKLSELGVRRVLYVAPTAADTLELDDVNELLVAWSGAGIDVKRIAVTDFAPEPADVGTQPAPSAPGEPADAELAHAYWGGRADRGPAFWRLYGWGPASAPPVDAPESLSNGWAYVPRPRPTPFSGAARPPDFGEVTVLVAAATGAILGAQLVRSGSRGRSSGSSGG
jgi:hypothetical protein